jgi:hypothetical protein
MNDRLPAAAAVAAVAAAAVCCCRCMIACTNFAAGEKKPQRC